MSNRREFITLLGGAAAAWPLVGLAQQRVMPVVGVLCAGTAQALERYLASFRESMRRLGYIEGSNVRFEFRFADGYLDRLPDTAIELVRLNPHVIVSTPLPAHLAARKATSTIPIVMATGADPVGFGLVASLSHPGGNVTGARPGGTLPHHPVARSHGHRDVADAGAGRMRACAISWHASLWARMSSSAALRSASLSSASATRRRSSSSALRSANRAARHGINACERLGDGGPTGSTS